jgi:hypothetical protein
MDDSKNAPQRWLRPPTAPIDELTEQYNHAVLAHADTLKAFGAAGERFVELGTDAAYEAFERAHAAEVKARRHVWRATKLRDAAKAKGAVGTVRPISHAAHFPKALGGLQ